MSVVLSVHLQFLSWSGLAILTPVIIVSVRTASHRVRRKLLRDRLRECYATLRGR